MRKDRVTVGAFEARTTRWTVRDITILMVVREQDEHDGV
jgi:hypothetical protein